MSYILDALKRADADRERGHVPGLHSQAGGERHRSNTGRGLNAGMAARWSSRMGWTLAFLLLAGLLAVAALTWRTSADPQPLTAEAPPPVDVAATPLPAPAAPPAVVEAAPPPAPSATVEPRAPAPTGPVLPILAPPEPPAVPVNRSAGSPATRQTAPAPVDAEPSASSAGTPAATAPAVAPAVAANVRSGRAGSAPAAAPVPRFADLAPELRAQLPAVSINGSTYSQNPAHRMLIANGKVVQEGGEIAPGLKLETIGPRSAVLNHQGTRYSIGY